MIGSPFAPWLQRWQLRQDGVERVMPSNRLLPVLCADGTPAMLKIIGDEIELKAAHSLTYWDGAGAAKVYALEGPALLMERATGTGSLMAMALDGRDDEASRIACDVIGQLHAPRAHAWPQDLVRLGPWFNSLEVAAAREGGVFTQAMTTATALLSQGEAVQPLHGDIHHENVLDFGPRGWLAIDPKPLLGERGFDYANLLCNPELPTVTQASRFHRQLAVIATAADLPVQRLAAWTLAYAGLSAAWFLEDGDSVRAESDLRVASLALGALE